MAKKKSKPPKKERGPLLPTLSKLGLGEIKEFVTENMAMLLSSGIDVASSLDALGKETKSPRMKSVLKKVADEIDSGVSLSIALDHTGLFASHVVALLKIGEDAGRLTENLKVIVMQQRKERAFRSKVKSAMMYPVFVMGLSVIIALGIAWFLLPRLTQIFSQLKIELPLITRGLIAIGAFLGDYGGIAVPGFAVVVSALFYVLFVAKKTKHLGQRLMFTFPGIRKLIMQVEIARLGFIFGTLLEAGLPIVQSLDSLEKATTFVMYKKLYAYLRDSIRDGMTFYDSFAGFKKINRLIPAPVQQMIVTGERSGRLPEVLKNIGETFEEKTETTTKNLTVILEPILLVSVWVGVVFVAVGVILPIYRLVGSFNAGAPPPPPPPPSLSQPSPSPLPLPEPVETEESSLPSLTISPTGFSILNVREDSSLEGEVITQVEAGSEYKYQDEQDGWYEILLEDGQTGWVLGTYVEIE